MKNAGMPPAFFYYSLYQQKEILYVKENDYASKHDSLRGSEEGCKKYDHGSAGYFSCEWISY